MLDLAHLHAARRFVADGPGQHRETFWRRVIGIDAQWRHGVDGAAQPLPLSQVVLLSPGAVEDAQFGRFDVARQSRPDARVGRNHPHCIGWWLGDGIENVDELAVGRLQLSGQGRGIAAATLQFGRTLRHQLVQLDPG